MIRRILVSNYRSIGPDVNIQPGRLSFLIGPNGSGKSNVLDALAFVRDAVIQGLPTAIKERDGIDSVRRRSDGRPFAMRISLEIDLDSGPCTYAFEISGGQIEKYEVQSEAATFSGKNQKWSFHRENGDWHGPQGVVPRMDEHGLALTALGGVEGFKPLVDFLSNITVYSIFPDTLRLPRRFDSTRPMQKHGENWVSILRDFGQEDEKAELIKGLHALTGDIEDVRVSSAAGYLVAEFKQRTKTQNGKGWFSAAQQSDGTLRVAGLLTALLQTPHLPVVGIEEPELTVHPAALPMLYDYLRQVSEVSQVFVTTHSPIMLDVVNPIHDTILVVNRVDGKTDVKKVGEWQLEPVRKNLLRLGDLFVSGDLQLSLFDELMEG